ncbi:MAG: hypothetical protein HY238_11465 [Acidobacteria bacterium]|nr:hypothetical protein [Acidobacteriota bacterium]
MTARDYFPMIRERRRKLSFNSLFLFVIADSSKFSARVQLLHIPWMFGKQRMERPA